jgi:hypothetical protein
MDRLARSLQLARASWSVVRADKELLLLPVLSVIATLLVAASFVVPAFAAGWFRSEAANAVEPNTLTYALMLAFYIVTCFVTIFFNTALVGAAMIRLDGGDPSLGDALSIAWQRVGRIAGYACIAGTVGLLLRALEERVGWLGRIVVGVIGVAWSLATFLVVPVLVARDLGPIEAVKESARMLRTTWGENLAGNLGLGFVFLLAFVVLFALAGGLVYAGVRLDLPVVAITTITVAVIGFALLVTLQATLQGVYSAALYRYAAGEPNQAPGFGPELMAQAFRAR